MKKITKILVILFLFLFATQTSLFASTFSKKMYYCSPYKAEYNGKLVQIVGYMNRKCVYRELSLDNSIQCVLSRENMTSIRKQIKILNFGISSLSELPLFDTQKASFSCSDGSVVKKD